MLAESAAIAVVRPPLPLHLSQAQRMAIAALFSVEVEPATLREARKTLKPIFAPIEEAGTALRLVARTRAAIRKVVLQGMREYGDAYGVWDVPLRDARGPITSHRARAPIATQLFNAKEPMTLFELQAWLGHRSPLSTQHYARITPTTLTKAYHDAGYFARNVRTIEVLIDRDAVQHGAPGAGEPWQYYDLAHGYCTYTFFEQCPHRMACARCDFYVPKDSSKAQLLEARGNLQRMLAQIPLTDDERAAVEDGSAAVEHLLERLADTPTPAGRTPREIAQASAFIPLTSLQKRTAASSEIGKEQS